MESIMKQFAANTMKRFMAGVGPWILLVVVLGLVIIAGYFFQPFPSS